MSTIENIGRSIRHTWDDLSEGWEQLWHKTRNALTRFSPDEEASTKATGASVSRWGLLSADVEENDDEVRVRLEVPGMEADDLSLEVVDQRLVVTGEKRYANESFEGRVFVMESAYGRFRREIPLPAAVDHADSKAKYKNGVLEVRLEKSHPSTSSRITVES